MNPLFTYLALLNLFDGIITFWGIKYYHIEEINPLMKSLYNKSPFLFLSLKTILSCLLYSLVLLDKVPEMKLVKGLAILATVLYTCVSLVHGSWIFQVSLDLRN